MSNYEDQKIYSEDEVVEILTGLLQVYWFQPWYTRWMWNPWKNAMQTAIMVFSGKKLLERFDKDQILRDLEDL